MPEQNSRDPSTWVRRREDPTILLLGERVETIAKVAKEAKWAGPVVTVIGTIIMGIFCAGMGFELYRANQITRAQFENEQSERRAAQQEADHRLSKLEGKIDTLILMQSGKGHNDRNR